MKHYTTGQVAKICGFAGAREVAKLIDREELRGELIDSRLGRKRTRFVHLSDLVEFMKRNRIPLDGFDGDVCAQKWILNQQILELRKMIAQARKRSGVFFGFKGLSDAVLEVIHIMDPLDNLSGLSEDRKRMMIFEKLTKTMACHIRLRGRIATSKK